MTTGEIGALVLNGQQVGGFLNWRIETHPEQKPSGQFVPTEASADAFWMLDSMPEVAEAQFYARLGNRLILMQQAKVSVKVPVCVSDKLIRHPIVMVFDEA